MRTFRNLAILVVQALLIAGLLGFPRPAQAQPVSVRFESLSVEDGLSQSTVRSILQDEQGFMWFGSDDGLNKYDGYAFTIYKHDPDNPQTISDNSILSMLQDSRGGLWFGTARGLNRFDREQETFRRYLQDPDNPTSLSGSTVNAIVEDGDGFLWIGTADGGLNRLDVENNTFLHYQHHPERKTSIISDTVTALAYDPKGGLWIATDNGLDYLDFGTQRFTHYQHDPQNTTSLSNDSVLSLFIDRVGILWVGTEAGGLNRFNPANQSFTRYQSRPGNPYSLVSNYVRAIFEDSKGHMWVGGQKALHLFDRKEDYFIHYQHDPNDPRSISNDHILSLFEDRSGVLWIGTYTGGLNKYNQINDRFLLYQHQPGVASSLSSDLVNAILEDGEGVLWVGTTGGGLNRLNRETNTFTIYLTNPSNVNSLSSNDVNALWEDHNNILWIGTNNGLDRYNRESGHFRHFVHNPNNPSSLSDNRVTAVYEDRRGNVWVGTQSGGLNLLDPIHGRFTHFRHDPDNPSSLAGDSISTIYEDRSGALWIGTYSGLSVMAPGTREFRSYVSDPKNPDSLSNNRVLSIHESADGIIWIGTLLGGLNRFDPGSQTFQHFTEKNGLPNDTIFGILEDQDHNLWLSTSRGLSRFSPAAGRFRNYDVRDGLQSDEFNAGAYFQNNRNMMYFGGIHGLNAFDPRSLQDNPVAPVIVITAFKKFNQVERKDLIEGEEITLSYQENFVSFEFAALDYHTPNKNQYAYMLEGFDKDWVYAGTRRYASYTNLRGGEYVFKVKGANKDGVWNETGTSVKINVIPPIWERWWFITSLGLVLVSAGLGSYWLRMDRIRRQQHQLEQQVRERTAEIARSATEIERRRQVAEGLREILSILNSNLTLRECLDSITQQATRLMNAQAVVIFRCGQGNFPVVVASNLPDSANVPLHRHDGPCKQGWISSPLLAGKTIVMPIIADSLHVDRNQNHSSPDGKDWEESLSQYGALLAVPLLVNDQVDGGLILAYTKPRAFSEEDQQTARSFADHSALAIANAHLRSQAEELAVSAERSRLARDLHDAVTQTLFATSLIADVLPRLWERNPDAGKQRLAEIRELTRGALAEMRTLLMELRPAALENVPLPDLLQQLAEAFTGRARVPVHLQLDHAILLPPPVKIGFYRIAQEGLNNIFKHARATQVEICLRQKDIITDSDIDDGAINNECIEMLIRDNGIGFDPHNHLPDHFGLGIMQERAESIGATFCVESKPKTLAGPASGTCITVTWILS